MHSGIQSFAEGLNLSKTNKGKVKVRISPSCIDPWKVIDEIGEANRGVDLKRLEVDIRTAIKAVRKRRRRG